MRSRSWVDDALCHKMSRDVADVVFFGKDAKRGQRQNPSTIERARAICEQCPVIWQCLDEVLVVPSAYDAHGIRAGLLPRERATLRDRQKAPGQIEARFWLGGDDTPHARPRR